MRERLVRIEKSPNAKKKYRAVIQRAGREFSVDFGARGYSQFRDSTGLGIYSRLDHGNRARRRNYFMRHSGVPTKAAAMRVENAKSPGKWTPKKLSHKYLW